MADDFGPPPLKEIQHLHNIEEIIRDERYQFFTKSAAVRIAKKQVTESLNEPRKPSRRKDNHG